MINRPAVATILHDAGDRLHSLARKIDPPAYGVRLVWDEDYEPWGDIDLAEERAKLDSGEWVVVGMIAIERDRNGVVRETDIPASLWGIVTSSTDINWGAWESNGRRADIFDLDELEGYLRELASQIISEAKP